MNKRRAVFDIECYSSFFMVAFRDIDDGRAKHFEMYDGHPLDRQGVIRILRNFTLVSFNGIHYDVPMLKLALRMGVTNRLLKCMNDDIIQRGLKYWECEKQYSLPEIPWLDHIDLIEPAPSVMVSLKLYGGRLHSRRLQDLPIEPDATIGPAERAVLIPYCLNDLATTIHLYRHLEPQLELRAQMSEQYGVDLRSKSDAQIAEAVIRKELERIKGDKIYRPEFSRDYTFKYRAPSFIEFKTQQMQELFDKICDHTFGLDYKGDVEMPEFLKKALIKIGGSRYRMGIGGLHSTESSVSHYSDDDFVLIDNDVASYYPAIILVCGLYPDHLGRDFLDVYRTLKERRIAAKRSGDKVTDMTLKITLNGCFGKMGSQYSFLYSPNLMIQVTITGQLALLMLIEHLELEGIPVISANTDGFVSKCPRDRVDEMRAMVRSWEVSTGFEMESVEYTALHSRDVNNYLGIKAAGGVKQKGAFAFAGSKGSPAEKNPSNYVCIDAVIAYLTKGTPLEETIEWCPDIRRFLSVRRVTGGATFEGRYLGRVVRWYTSTQSLSSIHYATNNNRVPKSDCAMPLMELTGELPSDIDYPYYVNEAIGMLGDMGVL